MQDRLAELEERLVIVERRLAALEGAPAPPQEPGTTEDESARDGGLLGKASTHIGRVLLIFGGAYLLRAITDFEFVPTAIGLAMGAAYALFWLYLSWRKAAVDTERATAAFYGATAILLALPLLVEAATTFGLLTGAEAVGALAIFFALALTVGVVRNLRSVAWLVIAGAGVTALALVITTHAAVPAAGFLLLAGLASLWAVYARDWLALQWLGAIGANGAAFALIGLAQSPQWSLDPGVAALFAIILLLTYFASFVIRSEVLHSDVRIFETVQVLVAAGLAFWASLITASGDGASLSVTTIGVLATLLGIVSYGVSLASRLRSSRRRNFYFYSSTGLLFAVVGTSLVLHSGSAAVLWSLAAVLLAWFSGRLGWVSLSLQCTTLLVAAGIVSGLLATGFAAFVGDPATFWPAVSLWDIGIASATVVCLFLPVAQHSERWGVLAGLPQLIVLLLSVWEVGGLIVALMAPVLTSAGSDSADQSLIAALRTVVLVAAAVSLALSSRFRRWPEARWLVYPVLVVVGIKLFAEDFPVGRPVTLFVALACIGGALLIAARLLRRSGDEATA